MALIAGMAVLAAVGIAEVARADSAGLSITRTDGQVDPAADVPRVFTVTGTTEAPKRLYVTHREPGGAPCAPTAYSDSGDDLDYFYGLSVNGAFSFQQAITWREAGPEMFCLWLASTSETVATPITQVVDFRRAGGTISATLTPTVPRPGATVTVQVTGNSEAPKYAYATLENAGAACAPTYDSAGGTELLSSSVNGLFSLSMTATAPSAGNYQLCLWLAESSSDAAPVAGPQAIPFSVVAPPAPCRVPAIARGAITLRTARSRLARKHCRVGAIRYVRSRTVRRGRVIRLSPRGPRTLAPGAAVTVIVSRGRS